MIKHVHVDECDSTQDLLKEQLKASEESVMVVSCENQVAGRGRGENVWKAMSGTICLSLNIKANTVLSYTALELSVLVAKFFESRGRSLKLKWPNDLWDSSKKKCGGILVQGSQNVFYAGIGVNLFSESEEYGGIYPEPFQIDKKVWSFDLAAFILDNRITDVKVLREEWAGRCGHLNEQVRITEGSDVYQGAFLGLGDFGEALIRSGEDILKVYNGSLRM